MSRSRGSAAFFLAWRRLRSRSRLFPVLVFLVLGALGVLGACGGNATPAETTATTTLPPITVCYEPDGEPCPAPDAGEDAGFDDAPSDATLVLDATGEVAAPLDARADGD